MNQHARKPPKPSPPSDPVAPDRLGEHEGVVFQRERLRPLLEEVVPLLEADWRENGIDHDKVPLKLDFGRYLDYDLTGILQIVTARDDGVLVGYQFVLVHPHIDHAGMGWAMLSWYWLYPEYRKQGVGKAMLGAMLDFLRSARISVVEGTEKIGHEHGVFEALGFKPTDVVKRKLLEV